MKPEIQVIVGLVVGLFATFLISGLLDSGPSTFGICFSMCHHKTVGFR